MSEDFRRKQVDSQLAASLARRFRLVRKLGQGGLSVVFLAEQIALGNRPVALKVLHPDLRNDPEFLQQFQNEAASLGRIQHANVVTLYESGQADDGTPYVAMEILEGETLRQSLDRRGALPVAEVAEILQQAARGLNAAHRLGIIHRDLTPVNIFLTYPDDVGAPPVGVRDAGTGDVPTLPYGIAVTGRAPDPPLWSAAVKLVNFGIAPPPEPDDPERPGLPLSLYWSYECLLGRRDEFDARSNIYSLGMVVYEMLTGRHPFEADTPVGHIYKQLKEGPPPFRTVKPDLTALPELENAVMKALSKDRDQRYRSVLEFSREFVRAVIPSGVRAGSDRRYNGA
jgi:serine/threonine-protein kinase